MLSAAELTRQLHQIRDLRRRCERLLVHYLDDERALAAQLRQVQVADYQAAMRGEQGGNDAENTTRHSDGEASGALSPGRAHHDLSLG